MLGIEREELIMQVLRDTRRKRPEGSMCTASTLLYDRLTTQRHFRKPLALQSSYPQVAIRNYEIDGWDWKGLFDFLGDFRIGNWVAAVGRAILLGCMARSGKGWSPAALW